MIPALGGTPIPVIAAGRAPVWSPDGTHLAFILSRLGEPEALAVAAADGADVRILLKSDDVYPFLNHPAWSPDGTLLAISRSGGGVAQEVWLVPAAGGTPRRMWQDPPGVFSGDPVFAPDGRGIIHASSRGGATNLWLMPVDGKEPVRLTSGPGPDASPSVSRTGTIAFVNSRTRNDAADPSVGYGRNTNPGHAPRRALGTVVFSGRARNCLCAQRSRRLLAYLDDTGQWRHTTPDHVKPIARNPSSLYA